MHPTSQATRASRYSVIAPLVPAGWLGRIVTKKGKTSLNADHVCHHHVHHLSSLHQQGDSVTLSLYSVVSHLICIKVATFTQSKDYRTLGFINQVDLNCMVSYIHDVTSNEGDPKAL